MRRGFNVRMGVAWGWFLVAASTGEAALVQSFQQSGNLDLELAAVAGGNSSNVMGSLALSKVNGPVVQATLYFANFNNMGSVHSVTFNGNPLGNVSPFAQDVTVAAQTFAYQANVTAMVAGPGNYTFSISDMSVGAGGIPGVALAVVFQDLSAPQSTVTIIDGIQQVGEVGPETEQVNFTGIPSGATDLSVFTVLDDNTHTGETVKYNNVNVGGPLDQNLGLNASLISAMTTSLAGSNSASITSGSGVGTDHLAWMLATSVVAVPEPSALLYVFAPLLAAVAVKCVLRRRRKVYKDNRLSGA